MKYFVILTLLVFFIFAQEPNLKAEKKATFSLDGNYYIYTDFSNKFTNIYQLGDWNLNLFPIKDLTLVTQITLEQASEDRSSRISFFENHNLDLEDFYLEYSHNKFTWLIGRFSIPQTLDDLYIKPAFSEEIFEQYEITGQQGFGLSYVLDKHSIDFRLFKEKNKTGNSSIYNIESSKSFFLSIGNREKPSTSFFYKVSAIFNNKKENRYIFSLNYTNKLTVIHRLSISSNFIFIEDSNEELLNKQLFFTFGVSYTLSGADLTFLGLQELNNQNGTQESFFTGQISLGIKLSKNTHLGFGYIFEEQKEDLANTTRISWRYRF